MRLALAFCLIATPVLADVETVLDDHILTGTAAFVAATQALDDTAADQCQAETMTGPWNAAMDAWMGIAHLRLGPGEQAALTIAYWPDERGAGRRTLARMIADEDPMGLDADAFSQVSVVARGLHAMETMLYDADFNGYQADSYACTLVSMMAQDIARQAQELDRAWREDFAPLLRTAGEPDNALYLSPKEAPQALFTQLHAGVEFVADQRLARPMGTPERPRPQLAENWRSGRSLRNVRLSLDALHQMATTLAGRHVAAVDEAFDTAAYFAGSVADPAFQDLDDPQARLRLESLEGQVRLINEVLLAEIGEPLGVRPGFNSGDGD